MLYAPEERFNLKEKYFKGTHTEERGGSELQSGNGQLRRCKLGIDSGESKI